jgi:hypothetical protein
MNNFSPLQVHSDVVTFDMFMSVSGGGSRVQDGYLNRYATLVIHV